MIRIKATPGEVLRLGRQGENLARCVEFSLSRFQSLYGEGVAQLLIIRPTENEAYPADLEVDGAEAIWNLTSADTAVSGHYGKAELRWYVGEVLAKSEIWNTVVTSALGEPSGEMPEPYENWMEDALRVAAEAEGFAIESRNAAELSAEAQRAAELSRIAAENAEKGAEENAGAALAAAQTAGNHSGAALAAANAAALQAQNAGNLAAAAQKSEQNAAAHERGAKTYSESAAKSAANAEEHKNGAKTYSENAATSAKTAANNAAAAKQSETGAKSSADNAAKSAKEAKEAAERIGKIRVENETLYF